MQILITSVFSNKFDLCFQLIPKEMQILTHPFWKSGCKSCIYQFWTCLEPTTCIIITLKAIMKCHITNLMHTMWWPLPSPFISHWKTLEPSNNDKIPTWSQQVLNIEYLCGNIWTYVCFLAMWQIKYEYYCCYASLQCFYCSWKDVSHNMWNTS
jgi:hypothetical protein